MDQIPSDLRPAGRGESSHEGDAAPTGVTLAGVLSWLEANLQLVAENPQFAALVNRSIGGQGGEVVDFQQRRLERLQDRLYDLEQQNRRIIATVRHNYLIQARVHQAIVELIAVDSLEQLLKLMTEEVAELLGLDALGFCLEVGGEARISERFLVAPKVRLVEPGTIAALLDDQPFILRAEVTGDREIFGADAARIRSDALLRLDLGASAPVVMVALGARRPGIFFPGQNTYLLKHFSEVVTLSLLRHLGPLPA